MGSVKEGTIYKGKIARPTLEVFSPGGADGRTIATGMFFSNNRLVVVGRQTGLMFVYNTKTGRLISKLDSVHPRYIHQLKHLVDDSFHQPLLDSPPFQRVQFL